jgi:hypothetical protein
MPPATARKPVYQSYEARRTLARLADRQAAVAAELKKLEADKARAAAIKARATAQTQAAVLQELARYKQLEAKYGAPAPPMHKMADAGGTWWQSTSLAVLRKHVGERNRTISSPAYRYVKAGGEEGRRRAGGGGRAEHKAVLGPGSRSFGLADDDLVEDWTDEFRDEDDDDWDDDDD